MDRVEISEMVMKLHNELASAFPDECTSTTVSVGHEQVTFISTPYREGDLYNVSMDDGGEKINIAIVDDFVTEADSEE